MVEEVKPKIIYDLSILDPEYIDKHNHKVILIVLNRPIQKEKISFLSKKADLIICADGGANRYYEALGEEGALPHIIIGDFDSIKNNVHEYYRNKGSNLIVRKDSRTTDFEKCLYIALEKVSDMENEFEIDYEPDFNIIIFGASGGRIDHTFNIYNLSCKYSEKFKDLIKAKFFLIGEASLSIIFNSKAENIVMCSTWENKEGGYSLFPISGVAETKIVELDENNKELEVTSKVH